MRHVAHAVPPLFVLLLATVFVSPAPVLGQVPGIVVEVPPEGTVQELLLRDGSTLFGRVVSTGDPFRFELISGQILEFRVADVRRLGVRAGRVVDGRFWRSDPNQTRLFFGPTGRSLKAGDGYLSVFELFFPILALGVSDRITIAGGTPLLFGDFGSQPFWFAPKVGILETERMAVAAGVLAFFTTESTESVGVLYGVASFGSSDQGAHVGVGYGYDRGGLASSPAVMLGGEIRVGQVVKLLTENYVLPSEGGILSAGIRFFGERLSADLGLATPVGTGDNFFAFPVVNFVWNW